MNQSVKILKSLLDAKTPTETILEVMGALLPDNPLSQNHVMVPFAAEKSPPKPERALNPPSMREPVVDDA